MCLALYLTGWKEPVMTWSRDWPYMPATCSAPARPLANYISPTSPRKLLNANNLVINIGLATWSPPSLYYLPAPYSLVL